MARRKVRKDRVLILILVFVLAILLIVLGVKYLLSNHDSQDEVTNNDVTNVTNENLIEIDNYQVYTKSDDLGFGFVVADIKFFSNEKIEYDFNNLVTEEGIKLSEISNYEKKLRTSNFDFDSLNTNNDIVFVENETIRKVFIPFENVKDKLTLIDNVSNYSYQIDLNKNTNSITFKDNNNSEEEIVSTSYKFSCYKPYVEDMMKHNGEPYDSSMLSIYVFKLKCESIKNGIKVTKATFSEEDGNKCEALDSSYSSSKIDNILDKTIVEGDTYALFFEIYSNIDENNKYEGNIDLYFSDGTTAKVEAVLD